MPDSDTIIVESFRLHARGPWNDRHFVFSFYDIDEKFWEIDLTQFAKVVHDPGAGPEHGIDVENEP